MSFQSGDVIAVTSTHEDAWWTGELIDKAKRVPGRNVLPSNFVKRIPKPVGFTEEGKPILFYGEKLVHIRCCDY